MILLIKTLAAVAVGAMLATSAFTQSAKAPQRITSSRTSPHPS
jgi:hypothetical protein